MLILKVSLAPLLALVLLGIVSVLGSLEVIISGHADRSDQSVDVSAEEYCSTSIVSSTQPVTPMLIGEPVNLAI